MADLAPRAHSDASTRAAASAHRLRRIDYYPSENAVAIIDKLRTGGVGGDASSILNRILSEWAAIPGINTGNRRQSAVGCEAGRRRA